MTILFSTRSEKTIRTGGANVFQRLIKDSPPCQKHDETLQKEAEPDRLRASSFDVDVAVGLEQAKNDSVGVASFQSNVRRIMSISSSE